MIILLLVFFLSVQDIEYWNKIVGLETFGLYLVQPDPTGKFFCDLFLYFVFNRTHLFNMLLSLFSFVSSGRGSNSSPVAFLYLAW